MTLKDLLRTGFITNRFAPERIYANYEVVAPLKDETESWRYGKWQRRDNSCTSYPNIKSYPQEIMDMEIMDYKKGSKELYLKGTYTPKKFQVIPRSDDDSTD